MSAATLAAIELFPLPAGKKFPPPRDVTGRDGTAYSGPWHGPVNIGGRMPATMIGLDIDGEDHGPGCIGPESIRAVEAKIGPLPDGPYITRHGEHSETRTRLFAIPEGVYLSERDLVDVEVIQHHHRYVVMPLSRLADGSTYDAYGPIEVPDLPAAWVEELRSDRAPTERPAKADVAAWLEAHGGEMDERIIWRVRSAQAREDMTRETLFGLLLGVAEAAEAGASGAAEGVAAIEDAWLDGWDEPKYRAQFDSALHDAVSRAVSARLTALEDDYAREPAEALERSQEADGPSPEVMAAVERMRVQDEARRIFAAERAEFVAVPEPVALGEFLEREFEPEAFVIDGLLPTGGNVVFSAQRKAGKTTTVHNVIRTLVDGDDFLDEFAPTVRRRVALLDFELSPGNLQRWLAEQQIDHTDDVAVFPLRGQGAAFNILDDSIRARWAVALRGYDVLIIDPLRPLMDALGLNEWHEAGRLLAPIDALKAEASISECIVAHHHGHSAERSRGDTRLEDWPDAIWRLTRDDTEDPRSPRYFDAYGRDVDVEKGLVEMRGRELVYAANVAEAKDAYRAKAIADRLRAAGEMNTEGIKRLGIRGVSKNTVAAVLAYGVANGILDVRDGDRNAKLYRAADGSNPFGREERTGDRFGLGRECERLG